MTAIAPERRPESSPFPTDGEFQKLLASRSRKSFAAQTGFLVALIIAVIALCALIYTVINDAFGLVAVVNAQNPDQVVASLGLDPTQVSLPDLDKDQLVELLAASVSSGVGRRLEREQRFYDDRLVFETQAVWDDVCARPDAPTGCTAGQRGQGDVLALVRSRVIQPDVIASNDLVPSLLNRSAFEESVRSAFDATPRRFGDYTVDQVRFEWRAWLNLDFVLSPQNSTPEIAGIRTALLGSTYLVLITMAFAIPVGVGAAIYLIEFANPSRLNELIQTNINNLAGVPSIIYGMLGLAVLVRTLEPLTSGSWFLGDGAASNGRTILSGGLTLGLLILPVVIISAQEALRSVPNSLRQAGMGLGATKWQTVRSQVIPVALPGILTGAILAVARAIGETAPLIVVGAAGFITSDPTGPFSNYTAMPIQIFQWTSLPQEEFRNIAAAAILVLLLLLLTMNAAAVILRNRFSRRV